MNPYAGPVAGCGARARRLWALSLPVLLLYSAGARALEGDPVRLHAQASVQEDSNVTRTGADPLSDRIVSEGAGVNLDLRWSRQRFTLDGDLAHTQYRRYSTLDNDSGNLAALWTVAAGSDLTGSLGYTDSRALQNLNNFQALVRDVVRRHAAEGRLGYAVDVRWHLEAAYSRSAQTNGAPTLAYNDNDTREAMVGLGYWLPTGNRVGIRRRDAQVTFANAQPLAAATSNTYRDGITELYASWVQDPPSSVTGSLFHQTRRFEVDTGRNLSGVVGGSVTYRWVNARNTSVEVVASRAVGGVDFLAAQVVISNDLALRTHWMYSEKLDFSAAMQGSRRSFSASPGVLSRVEDVRDLDLGATWRFIDAASLAVNWRHESRRSDTPGYDYGDQLYGLTMNIRL